MSEDSSLFEVLLDFAALLLFLPFLMTVGAVVWVLTHVMQAWL